MRKVIHFGWETTYPESNEPFDWGTACGLDSFDKYTDNWNKVTCKRCLKKMPQNTSEKSSSLSSCSPPNRDKNMKSNEMVIGETYILQGGSAHITATLKKIESYPATGMPRDFIFENFRLPGNVFSLPEGILNMLIVEKS